MSSCLSCEVIMVEFPNYSGPSFTEENPKIVPIVPVEKRIECSCHSCSRKTIPLKLGWTTTIHKCQGMTIGEGEPNRYIVIHPGTKRRSTVVWKLDHNDFWQRIYWITSCLVYDVYNRADSSAK
jgi:hypothetical protein